MATGFFFLHFVLLVGIGLLACRFMFPKLSPLVTIVIAPLVAMLLTVWSYFLTIWAVGFTTGIELVTGASIVILSVALVLRLKYVRLPQATHKNLTQLKKQIVSRPILFTSLFCWVIFLSFLTYTHLLEPKIDGYYSGGGAWGDLALHSTFTTYFAEQEILSLRSPIYAQEVTTYPFLINFWSAILFRQSGLLSLSLMSTSLLMILIIAVLLHAVGSQWLRKQSSIVMFTLLFLLNGGVGWWYFWKDWQLSGLSLWDFLWNMKVEYAHLADFDLRWSNVIADYFMPQRAFIVGLASFLACIYLWKHTHTLLETADSKKEKNAAYRTWFFCCSLIGLLPFFHVHAFLVLIVMAITLNAWMVFTKRLPVWLGTASSITPLLLSAPQIYWQFFHTLQPSFVSWLPGWLADKQSWIIFWLRNMGPLFVIIPLSLLVLFFSPFFKEKKWHVLKLLAFLSTGLFGVTNLISFQPHHYDNMKFMLFAYVIFCLVVSVIWEKLTRSLPSIGFSIAVIFLLTITIPTGVLSVWRESYTSWPIASSKNLERAAIIRDLTPPDAIFLTADNHVHMIPMLSGRAIVMGYRGWLWTHGIDYKNTEIMTQEIFTAGPNAKNYIDYLNISYVFIGPDEKVTWKANSKYFDAVYEKVYADSEVSVYKVR